MVVLPYGRVPYPLHLGDRPFVVVEPPKLPEPAPLETLIDQALDSPIGRPRLEQLAPAGTAVTVIVSDGTRKEPRAMFLAALRRRLPGVRWTIAIATGTHGPAGIASLGIPPHLLADARIVDHDGHDDRDLVALGTTSRGTTARVHRCLLETDLVIATGCIRPHYFAGFGAGVKAIFPGMGGAHEIRTNHLLKQEPGARAGIVDGNPCREDLEEVVRFLPTATFLLDGVCGPDDVVHAVVCGDPRLAFRDGIAQARPWFTVRAPRADLVIASDALPVSGSLYQAAKIAAAVCPLVAASGTLVIVAECSNGLGAPLATVNEAIFRIGILPRLAAGARLRLVSGLSRETVSETLVEHVASVDDLIASTTGGIVVVPRASQLIVEPTS